MFSKTSHFTRVSSDFIVSSQVGLSEVSRGQVGLSQFGFKSYESWIESGFLCKVELS